MLNKTFMGFSGTVAKLPRKLFQTSQVRKAIRLHPGSMRPIRPDKIPEPPLQISVNHIGRPGAISPPIGHQILGDWIIKLRDNTPAIPLQVSNDLATLDLCTVFNRDIPACRINGIN